MRKMQKPEEPWIARMSRMDTCVLPDTDALQLHAKFSAASDRALPLFLNHVCISVIRGEFCFGAGCTADFPRRVLGTGDHGV